MYTNNNNVISNKSIISNKVHGYAGYDDTKNKIIWINLADLNKSAMLKVAHFV